MRRARRGRGRLSEIERLPQWAEEAKRWAFDELRKRELTQLEILDGFNDRLKAAAWGEGITEPPVISRSAFNRTAVRLAVLGRRLQETREIAAVLAPRMEEIGDQELTLLVAETIKTLISEMLSGAGDLAADGDTAEMLMFTSRALKHAEEAKKISTAHRQKVQEEFKAQATKAVDAVAKMKGISAETVEAIKSTVLGVTK